MQRPSWEIRGQGAEGAQVEAGQAAQVESALGMGVRAGGGSIPKVRGPAEGCLESWALPWESRPLCAGCPQAGAG